LQSALGETLQAEIDVTSLSAEEASNLRVRIAGPDAYRAAGVDYNNVLPGTTATLLRRPDGRPWRCPALRTAAGRSGSRGGVRFP
jgi:pilus assembly protein FimV